ncbi:MAG TPA: DUF6064 family protein [Thermoanaerobaculia bacterium]|jgi:tetratricopeptide (TPR) repeat protein|nr:DUF6064 family protein [Thermoanaerobaculia bacterium]
MVVEVPTTPLSFVPLLGTSAVPLSYILGLTAVFLLAFRRRWAHRFSSLILAALWACMALALVLADIAAPSPTWQSILAAFNPFERPGLMTCLSAVFFVQSLLFVLEGLVRTGKDGTKGRLSFEPRASAGPVAGGLFLLYSLIIHPLLASLNVGFFPKSVLGLPFHGVLFTFGLLLFLKRGFHRYVLAVPLAWAALGGLAAFRHDEIPDFGLLAALLAGAFLALPRRKTVPDPEGNLRLETWYEHAARHHRTCGRTLLALLLLTCMIGFTRGAVGRNHPFLLPAAQLEISFTLLSALLLGLWLSLPAWYSAGFRLLGWEAGRWLRAGRKGWDWLTAHWGGILLLLGLLVYAGWEVYDGVKDMRAAREARRTTAAHVQQTEKQAEQQAEQAEEDAEKNLVLTALAMVMLSVIYGARRRIIISGFTNRTGEAELDSLAAGLASRLHNELASITSLYRTIDEAMPPQKGSVIGVTVGVEDVVSSLNDVLTADASIKLGKIEIPVGLLFQGLSRLVQGPRLSGSVHREGTNYLVIADLTGGGMCGSWRVAFADIEEEQLKDVGTAAPADDEAEKAAGRAMLYQMAEQLAYRIITSVGNLGSPRWEAVRSFTHGLRSYRGTQHVKGDASPELRAAEREFIQALSMDRNFSQCHHNLGVIYQALGVPESAEAAYRQALAENPDWSEAYYALATVFFENELYDKAAIFARKMIEIRPDDARAWNLNGLARFQQREKEARDRNQLEQEYSGQAWDEIVQSFKIAAAVAWRALCRAALRVSSRSLSKETQLAVRCTNNLAIVKGDEGDGDARRTVLEQSFRISPRDPRAHLVCGESLFEEQKWHESRTELYKVFGDALDLVDHVERWIYLLGVHSAVWSRSRSDRDETDVKRSYASLLVHVAPPESMVLANGQDDEADAQRKTAYDRQLRGFETSLLLVRRSLGPGHDPFAAPLAAIHFLRELEVKGQTSAVPGIGDPDLQEWARVQVQLHRGRSLVETQPAQAAEEITAVIEHLEGKRQSRQAELLDWKGLSRQVEHQGLYSLLAKAWLLADRKGEKDRGTAARHAEKSVAQEPGSSARRWILADAYSALGDFQEACNERETALRLGPGWEVVTDLAALNRIARDYLLLLGPRDMPAPEARVRRGLRFFERILQIIESRRPSRTRVQCTAHAAAHFWLGRLHCELGQIDQGLDHLRIARSMSFRPVEVALQMGNLFSYKRDYEEADRAFFESFRAMRQIARENGNGNKLLADGGPVEPLEVEALLSWAMLWVERGIRLKDATRLCKCAGARLPKVKGERRNALRALHSECLGWILFQEGKIDDARKELERAARLSSARSIQARLAKVYEAAGESKLLDPKEAAKKVAEARGKAGIANGNVHRKGVFDLWLHWQTTSETAAPPN